MTTEIIKCSKCEAEKSASEFYKSDGRTCKYCRALRGEKNRAAKIPSYIPRRLVDGKKVCRGCRTAKSLGEFASGKGGTLSRCRPCRLKVSKEWKAANKDQVKAAARKYRESDPDAARARTYAWLAKNPEWHADHKLRMKVKKFGLTVEQYLAMIEGQGNKCGNLACGRPIAKQDKGTHIDHCHESNRVRGILCGQCNRGQGYVSSPALLRAAADYLERHAAKLN